MDGIRGEGSRSFRNEGGEGVWKTRIINLKQTGKEIHIRDLYIRINKFKKVYRSRPNLVKYENGDLCCRYH
jgi:hypothetical protein